MPLNLAPHSRFARRWLFDRNRIGGRKSVLKGLIERLFPAVAFSHLAIAMILIRFALRLGNCFGSPIGLLKTSNRPPRSPSDVRVSRLGHELIGPNRELS